MKNDLILIEDYRVRRLYDEETETWCFSVLDIVQKLTQQFEFQAPRNRWNVLKNRLNKESRQSITNCKRLKLEATDGKNTSRTLPASHRFSLALRSLFYIYVEKVVHNKTFPVDNFTKTSCLV